MGNIFSMKEALNEAVAGTINNQSVKELQSELLEIYNDVFLSCEKFGLKLFLQGGSLLGKVRHNGFIPWDDDMDLGLLREEYDKLPMLFEQDLCNKYELRMPRYKGKSRTRFAKIYKKGEAESDGLSIDIFPIDYVPRNVITKYIKGISCNLLVAISGSIEFINNFPRDKKNALKRSIKGRMNYDLRLLINILFRIVPLEKWHERLDRCVSNKCVSSYCTSSLGRWHYFGEIQPTSVFLPLRVTDFCGYVAWTINQEDKYLEHNYGPNYMKIPDSSEREIHVM